jgi:hypothetical protein
MLKTRFVSLSVVIGTATLLAACGSGLLYEPHTVEKHSDAGAFTIAATMVET